MLFLDTLAAAKPDFVGTNVWLARNGEYAAHGMWGNVKEYPATCGCLVCLSRTKHPTRRNVSDTTS